MTTAPPSSKTTHRPPRRVFVRDLEIMANVGIFEVEHRYEQRIVVSLDLDVLDGYDGHSERIGDVLDYSRIVIDTELLIQSTHFKLIETLAERIAELCLSHPTVIAATIKIEKPDIMPRCRAVGIEIHRTRAMRTAPIVTTSPPR
jgi:7,8-dihydroneopterin aldolase/epimerase/oxygenase